MRVRRVAATVLGDLDAPVAPGCPRRRARRRDEAVRADAVRSLARSGAIDAVPDVLDGRPMRHRRCGSRQPALCARSAYPRKPHPMQRRPSCTTATRSCGRAPRIAVLDGHPAATNTLVELAGSGDDDVRTAAFREMRGLGSKVARRRARRHAGRRTARAGRSRPCVRGLVRIDSDSEGVRALDALVSAACDRQRVVREAARDGLATIGEPAVDPLMRSLDARDLRAGALAALERLPVGDRADELRAFAVSAVQQAVERHAVGAALEDDGGEAVRLLGDSLLFLSERDAVLGLRAAAMIDGGPRCASRSRTSRWPTQVSGPTPSKSRAWLSVTSSDPC